jgi:hypothetical protein
MFGTNPEYVRLALKVKEEMPQLVPAIMAGEMTIGAARRRLAILAGRPTKLDRKSTRQNRARVRAQQEVIGDLAPPPVSPDAMLSMYWKIASLEERERFLEAIADDIIDFVHRREVEGVI